jgi:CRP-like cAMP-binding protein
VTAERSAEVAEKLSGVPLFASLDSAELEAISALVIPFDAPAGHVLVQPGSVGTGLFLIEDGTVTLSVHDRSLELGPGEFFGELALLDDRAVRTARVRAHTPVNGYCITRDDFRELLQRDPTIAVYMLKVLAHRLVDVIGTH